MIILTSLFTFWTAALRCNAAFWQGGQADEAVDIQRLIIELTHVQNIRTP